MIDFSMNMDLFSLVVNFSNFIIPYVSSIPIRAIVFLISALILFLLKLLFSKLMRVKKADPLVETAAPSGEAMKPRFLKKWKNRSFIFAIFALFLIVSLIGTTKMIRLGAFLFQDESTLVITKGNFNWIELDSENKLLYVVGHGTNRILAYHTDQLSDPPATSEPMNQRAQSIAINHLADEIYYPTRNEIIVLGISDLKIKEKIQIPQLSPGDVWIVWDEKNSQIILSSEADENKDHPFLIVDRETGKVISDEPLNAWNIYLHPNENILYLGPRFQEKKYYLFDTSKHQIVDAFESGELGDRMILDENRNELLIAAPSKSRISRYNPTTFEYLGSIQANWGVRSLAIDREHDLLFAGSLVDNTLIMIDLNTYKTIRKYWVGPWIRTIVLDTDNRLAYLSTKYALVRINY